MTASVWAVPQKAIRTIKKPTEVRVESGHRMYVAPISRDALPENIRKDATDWTTFYEVRNFDATGVVFMYLAKGYKHPSPEYANDPKAHAPKQITAYYVNGEMWSSYGETFQDAINGAQRDGWLATMRTR